MSAFINDQNEEIEVLNSIFPTELEIVSTADCEGSFHKFKISLQPCQDDEANHVKVILLCEFPTEYPQIVPIL